MHTNRPRAFTLIELLIVVAIILILVAIGAPIVASMQRRADRLECAKNLRELGRLITANRTAEMLPKGGQTPADWPLSILGNLDSREILTCPAPDTGAPTDPASQPWATSSYVYLGNLTPTYECSHSGGSKQIWKLYWSGVYYIGGHNDGGRNTNDDTFASTKGYRLSDNLMFDKTEADSGEPNTPAIPDHQDLGHFKTYKPLDRRALRQVPDGTDTGARPLLADIVVLTQRPASAGAGPLAWQFANRFVTGDDKDAGILFANHCETSAGSKTDWGINVYYTDSTVQWKKWDELRFQVKAPDVDGATSHYYFY